MAKEKEEAKAESAAKAEAKSEDNAKAGDKALLAEAEALGIKESRVSLTGFKSKKGIKPEDIVREEARVAKKTRSRLAKAVTNAKALAKMKPINKRLALLISRFKAVVSRTRPQNYTDEIIAAWTEEYNLIKSSPRSWVKLTSNGKTPFVPQGRKKKTAREKLDELDLNND